MGQSQESNKNMNEQDLHSQRYEVDLHLLQIETIIPSTFSYQMQNIIYEIQKLMIQIQQNEMQKYLIHTLNYRFQRIVQIDQQAFHLGKDFNNKGQNKQIQWIELENKQSFLKLVKIIQKNYLIQSKIKQQYQKQLQGFDKKIILNPNSKFQTFRKNTLNHLEVTRNMSQFTIIRLILYFYLKMLKLNANSNTRHILKFHQETGKMLCLLIFHQYIELEQLFEIFYQLVCIDKYGDKVLTQKLSKFHKRYNGTCLKYSYCINMNKNKMQAIKTATHVYLDQLYLKSLQEAQDPQIKIADDTLLPIKVFPISRVKDKQKV